MLRKQVVKFGLYIKNSTAVTSAIDLQAVTVGGDVATFIAACFTPGVQRAAFSQKSIKQRRTNHLYLAPYLAKCSVASQQA